MQPGLVGDPVQWLHAPAAVPHQGPQDLLQLQLDQLTPPASQPGLCHRQPHSC